jgi:hypothetical protein
MMTINVLPLDCDDGSPPAFGKAMQLGYRKK